MWPALADGPPVPTLVADACATIGAGPASAERRQCATELAGLLASGGPMRLPAGAAAARLARGTDLRGPCRRFYPAAARDAHEAGATDLLFYVGTDGRVKQTLVERTSGSARLDAATARCLYVVGRFVPQSVDGRPVGSWQRIHYAWHLTEARNP